MLRICLRTSLGRDLEWDIKDPMQDSQGNRESLKKTWDTARAMTRVVLGGGYILNHPVAHAAGPG